MAIPEVALYHYKARVYDPVFGHFLQTDPIGTDGGINLYAYVGDDPTDLDDPMGLSSQFGGGGDGGGGRGGGGGGNGWLHAGLGAASFCPSICGSAFSAADGALYQHEGDNVNAGIAYGAAAIGLFADAGAFKLGARGVEAGLDAARDAGWLRSLARGCGCFEAGTLVDTATGLRPIEQIKIGDLVRSRDAAAGTTALEPVTALIRPHDRRLYEVRLEQPGSHTAETFAVTDDHPWMARDGHWLTTLQLTPGGELQTEDRKGVRVLSVTATARVADTYNLEVAAFHTYFVGNERVGCIMLGVQGISNLSKSQLHIISASTGRKSVPSPPHSMSEKPRRSRRILGAQIR